MEGICAVQARAIESGSNRGLVIGGPFCAIAIRRFSLDEARPKPSLAFVVGGCDKSGKVDAGQQLISGSGYLSDKVLRERALAGARKIVSRSRSGLRRLAWSVEAAKRTLRSR